MKKKTKPNEKKEEKKMRKSKMMSKVLHKPRTDQAYYSYYEVLWVRFGERILPVSAPQDSYRGSYSGSESPSAEVVLF